MEQYAMANQAYLCDNSPTISKPRRADYAPYDKLPAFEQGIKDYAANVYNRAYSNGVEQQAYDRGLEYAMRLARQGECSFSC
jgi:hypothetical protein